MKFFILCIDYFLHKIDSVLICKTVLNNTLSKGLFLMLKPSLETMPVNDIPLNITIHDLINNKLKSNFEIIDI